MIDAIGRPQSVLVLGGSSEIARAVVGKLVPGRCRTVVLAGRTGTRLIEAAEEARVAGAETVETVAFDARDVAGAPVGLVSGPAVAGSERLRVTWRCRSKKLVGAGGSSVGLSELSEGINHEYNQLDQASPQWKFVPSNRPT